MKLADYKTQDLDTSIDQRKTANLLMNLRTWHIELNNSLSTTIQLDVLIIN